MYQNRRRQPGMGLMLLFYQLFGVIGIDRIPPVTLGCIGLQVAIFLRLFKLPWRGPSDICISAYNVWRKKQFSRLIFGAFEHGDDWHLYYNMISFALKGQSLERRYGSKKFLYIIACFTVLTNIVLVALSIFAGEFFDHSERECAVGFSGVIFALKVLTTYYDSNFTHQIMGIPLLMPARYAVWVELLLIQILVPNVSFFGHLAGVLVGMAYVKGPLKYFMDMIYSLVFSIASPVPPSQPRFTSRSERSGYSENTYSQYVPFGMSEEEQIRKAMEESMDDSQRTGTSPPYPSDFQFGNNPYPSNFQSSNNPPPPGFVFRNDLQSPPPPGIYPDIDELRARRNSRYTSS